jgi:hypothetical protein
VLVGTIPSPEEVGEGVSDTSGVVDGVGVNVSVGTGVSVGMARAVWVRSAAKVPTACVWMDSTLKVGIASISLDPQLPRKILVSRNSPNKRLGSVEFFTDRTMI